MAIAVCALVYGMRRKTKEQHRMDKRKIVAALLVDLRVHNPLRGLSRAAKRTFEEEIGTLGKSRISTKKNHTRSWSASHVAHPEESFASSSDTSFTRSLSDVGVDRMSYSSSEKS